MKKIPKRYLKNDKLVIMMKIETEEKKRKRERRYRGKEVYEAVFKHIKKR